MEDVAIAIVFAITGWMLRTYLTHQERMKELSMAKQGLGAAEQRLARVEHAVEAIAVEVERIGEGQRFVTTLLNERAQPVPEKLPGGPSNRDAALTSR